MQIPGTPSLTFLAYLLLFLPWVSLRSARRLRVMRGSGPADASLDRTQIWVSTLVGQVVLLVLAVWVGQSFGYPFFELGPLGARELAAGLGAFVLLLVLRVVARALHSAAERRALLVYALSPRTPKEWLLWTLTVALAGVAEEAAYRGVGFSILWYALGSPWVAALVCALAFALAHWAQGWKSAAVIFGMALVFHGLVVFTGTLLIAVVVHIAYDAIASILISRQAERDDLGSRA